MSVWAKGLWRGSRVGAEAAGVGSGFAALDRVLGGGWPRGGLVEVLHERAGVGELRLVMPALAALSRRDGRWIFMVGPPGLPFAPALAQAGVDLRRLVIVQPGRREEGLWALEKALASGGCSAALAWPGAIGARQLRRLQLAGKAGGCLGLVFRHASAARQPSPAPVRVLVRALHACGVEVKVLKRPGGWETGFVRLAFADALQEATPDFRGLLEGRDG